MSDLKMKIECIINDGIKKGKYADKTDLTRKLAKLVSLLNYAILSEKERNEILVVIQVIKDIHHNLYNNPEFLKANDIHVCKWNGCNKEFKSHRGLMSHKSRQKHHY